MKNVSLVWGVLATILMAGSFIPCFECFQWPTIVFAACGIVLSGIKLASARREDRMASAIGLGCCAFAILLIIIKMSMGTVVVYDPYWP